MNHMKSIGSRIKAIREAKNLSIEDLAKKSGLDVKFIKSIENGEEEDPTVGDLAQLTKVLNTRLGTLLDGEEDLGAAVSSIEEAKESPVIRSKNSERGYMHFYTLTMQKKNKQMHTYYVEIQPSRGKKTFSTHEGEEFIYVIDGSIEVIYGKETYKIKEGGTIYYDSIVPHYIGSASAIKKAKVLCVVYMPA